MPRRRSLGELLEQRAEALSSVTDLVRRAEHAGLIVREQSGADGRVAILRLTAEGERRLARSFHAHGLGESEAGRELDRHQHVHTVSQQCAQHARCPVVIVRAPAAAKEQ